MTPPLPWLLGYQRLAGACDLLTGLLLLFLPYQTLHWMWFRAPEEFASRAGISMIGAFVLSTGLAYLVTARQPRYPAQMARLETTMLITAVTRAIIAIFLTSQLALGRLEWPWITVAMTDGSMALLQAFGLQKGWWRWKDSPL